MNNGSSQRRHRIEIAGYGFGRLCAARALRGADVDVTGDLLRRRFETLCGTFTVISQERSYWKGEPEGREQE